MTSQKNVPANQKQQVLMQRICCLLILLGGLLCINMGQPAFVAMGTVMVLFAVGFFIVVQVAARRAQKAGPQQG